MSLKQFPKKVEHTEAQKIHSPCLSVLSITFFLTKFPLMWGGKAVVFHLQLMEDLGRAYNRGAPFAVRPHT